MRLLRSGRMLLLLGIFAREARTNPNDLSVPSPANSTTPQCLSVCPGGDIPLDVVVRDLRPCPGMVYCPGGTSLPVTQTNIHGQARLLIAAGGGCANQSLLLYADGVVLKTYTSVASPDQDGDLLVTPADIAIVTSKLGSNDRTADFNCDGVVTGFDVILAESHMGHHCEAVSGVQGALPFAFALLQNHPNPFTGRTAIRYALAARATVSLEVFNLQGERVATLVHGEQEPGEYDVPFGLETGRGVLTPGIYCYRLRAGAFESTKRMLVLR